MSNSPTDGKETASLDEDGFYLKVARALSGCQLVEQQLKLFIAEAFELVKKCVKGKMHFNMSGDDYADASLERPIGTFKKLTDNEKLVTDLNKFKEERNFLSHQGIAHCLDYEGELFYSTAFEFQPRLMAIENEAERLRLAIHDESHGIRAYLWFDPIEDRKNSS